MFSALTRLCPPTQVVDVTSDPSFLTLSIYGAATVAAAEQALERFAARWDVPYPPISPSWLADWDRRTVLFDYPPAIRRVMYTTNAIES